VRDDEVMDRARALARDARAATPPWPAVGCVLVRDGAVVGEGATGPYPIGPHAEVAALRDAGERANGATAYVTLEPCAHTANTPPCANALIDANVVRVVVALEDPDERVAGRGIARLRDAGIAVDVGVGAGAVADDLAPYVHHRRTGRAYVVGKVATSIDGRVAAADGTSQWISSEMSRADVHRLRRESQAILVGSGTALADSPSLTVRGVDAPARPPLRVVCDARGRVPAEGPLFDSSLAPTLVVTTDAAPAEVADAWRAAGAKVEVVTRGRDGGVDLDDTLTLLGREGVLQVLIEGGGTLLGRALSDGCVNRLVVYVAPLVLGANGTPAFGDGPATLSDATRFRLRDARQLENDMRLEYEVA
jgi:diaminohydroxyphosphoribosylaminopyrimidine deaminase/5-amino-6-(5-phosphoribosylamino)uracil reductase